MLRLSTHVSCGVVLLLLAQFLLPTLAAPSASAQSTGNWLVYHQITNLPEETGSLGYPMLSGDGTTAVFSEARGTGDPATPNRILTIGSDGSGMPAVDSYVPLCFCGAIVDISNDGGTVVSTDSMQVLLDDGTNGDAVAGDDTYTVGGIEHGIFVVRDPDTGPRTVRIAAEIEDTSGLRHATAVDIGTLTVDDAAAANR